PASDPAPDPNGYIRTNACVDPVTLKQDPTCDPTKHPVLVAAQSVVVDPSKVLSSSVWSNPLVQAVVPGLLFAPADVVVPSILNVQPDGSIVAKPLPYANNLATAVGETKGLYRSKLVD